MSKIIKSRTFIPANIYIITKGVDHYNFSYFLNPHIQATLLPNKGQIASMALEELSERVNRQTDGQMDGWMTDRK